MSIKERLEMLKDSLECRGVGIFYYFDAKELLEILIDAYDVAEQPQPKEE